LIELLFMLIFFKLTELSKTFTMSTILQLYKVNYSKNKPHFLLNSIICSSFIEVYDNSSFLIFFNLLSLNYLSYLQPYKINSSNDCIL